MLRKDMILHEENTGAHVDYLLSLVQRQQERISDLEYVTQRDRGKVQREFNSLLSAIVRGQKRFNELVESTQAVQEAIGDLEENQELTEEKYNNLNRVSQSQAQLIKSLSLDKENK
jgi:predicted  nucleic acid-binding Zn-ribbon protein